MQTNPITYYIGVFIGGLFILALFALPIVLIVIAVRNYRALRKEVDSYHAIVEAEDLEAARQRAIADAEQAAIEKEMKEKASAADHSVETSSKEPSNEE